MNINSLFQLLISKLVIKFSHLGKFLEKESELTMYLIFQKGELDEIWSSSGFWLVMSQNYDNMRKLFFQTLHKINSLTPVATGRKS